MIKPRLADTQPLPVHPTLRHPFTGDPLQALGFRRNGAPIWPVIGGSQPVGGPAPGAAQPPTVQPGGQPPAGQFVPGGAGGVPVPYFGPGGVPQQGQPQPGVMPGQPPMFGQPPQTYAQPPQAYAWTPPAVPGYAPPQQQPVGQPFAFPFPVPPQGPPAGAPQQPGAPQQQPPNGGAPAGQQPPQGGAQQPSGSGSGSGGEWDKPYPQKPLNEMTDAEQAAYWKYHNRKLEDRLRYMGDYDQMKQQLGQLQAMTQTEWQRAVLEAETRGRNSAMEQAAGQMVAVAFQGAASSRMTPDQIQAQLGVLDPKRFVHNGQVDIAAIHQYVDTIAPARQNGLLPVIPQGGHPQQLPLPQVPIGQPLQPGQPGYAQQPTFGPIPGQQQQQFGGAFGQPPFGGQQFALPQHPQFAQQQFGGQPVGGQVLPAGGYGQVPIPGVPAPYQPASHVAQPVVQAAGVGGLPTLANGGGQLMLPAAADFGQGPAMGMVHNPQTSGAATAAARHGTTRTAQLGKTRA